MNFHVEIYQFFKRFPNTYLGTLFCDKIGGEEVEQMPKILKDFLVYLTTIKGKSLRTRKEYEYDIVLFLRFLKALLLHVSVR